MEIRIEKSTRLTEKIYDYFRQGRADWDRQNVRFSDVSAKCMRKIWYEFHEPDKKQPLPDKTLVRFALGNQTHDIVQHRLITIGALTDTEASMTNKETGARGRCDGRLKLSELVIGGTGKSIFEFKTANLYKFKEMKETGLPASEYVDQAMLYMGEMGDQEADIAALDLNDGELIGWVVYFDQCRYDELIENQKRMARLKTTTRIPARPFLRDSIPCSYCRMSNHCWKDVPAVVEPQLSVLKEGEKPSQELLDSAVKVMNSAPDKAKKLKKEIEDAQEILWRFFKATGETQVANIMRIPSQTRSVDINKLFTRVSLENIKPWLTIKLSLKELEDAVKHGVLDGGIAQSCITVENGEKIKVVEGE